MSFLQDTLMLLYVGELTRWLCSKSHKGLSRLSQLSTRRAQDAKT